MSIFLFILWLIAVYGLIISFTSKKEWRVSDSARKLARVGLIGLWIALPFAFFTGLFYILMFLSPPEPDNWGAGIMVSILLLGTILFGIPSIILSILYKGQDKPFVIIRKFIAYPILIILLLLCIPSLIRGVASDSRSIYQDIKWAQTKKISKDEAIKIAQDYIAKNNPEQKNPQIDTYDISSIPAQPLNHPNPQNIKKDSLRFSFTYDGSTNGKRSCYHWVVLDIVDGRILDSFTGCNGAVESPNESLSNPNVKIDIGQSFQLIVSNPADYVPTNTMSKPASGMKFLSLELTYFNDSDVSGNIDPSNLTLVDSNNQSYAVDVAVEKEPGLKYNAVVPANSSVKGFVVYEVLINAKVIKAIYLNSDVKITINF